MRAAGNAAGAARELRESQGNKRADGSVTTPRGDKPSPRSQGPPPAEAAASFSAPVHVDDALAKRVKTAMTKRIAVVQACPDAGLAYAALQDSQDSLAANRGELITLRANYKELYDICESWHEKCDALTAAAEAHAEEPQWRKEAEQTLAGPVQIDVVRAARMRRLGAPTTSGRVVEGFPCYGEPPIAYIGAG